LGEKIQPEGAYSLGKEGKNWVWGDGTGNEKDSRGRKEEGNTTKKARSDAIFQVKGKEFPFGGKEAEGHGGRETGM